MGKHRPNSVKKACALLCVHLFIAQGLFNFAFGSDFVEQTFDSRVIASELLKNNGTAEAADSGSRAGSLHHKHHNKTVKGECLDCTYTPDSPAPTAEVPVCADALCIVDALLEKHSLIYVSDHIRLSGAPFPDIMDEVTIMGTCSKGSLCRIDARAETNIFVVGLGGYLTVKNLELANGVCKKGAAIMVSGSGTADENAGGKLAAHGIKFYNNSAIIGGGAVYVEAGAVAYIRDSMFQENKAGMGGGIYVGASKMFPTNESSSNSVMGKSQCSLTSCTTLSNCEFYQNGAIVGGASYIDDSSTDCADHGGAKLDCTTCTYRENSAAEDGGAIFLNFESNGAVGTFRNSVFLNNTAKRYGGDVATQLGKYESRGTQFSAYQSKFSDSSAPRGNSVAIKRFSTATFSKCDFSSYPDEESATLCQGDCHNFCPTDASPADGPWARGMKRDPEGDSCPVVPEALCSWFPVDCTPPPPPSPPPPSPPPPSPPPPSPPPPSPPPPSPSPPPPSPPPPSPPPPSPSPPPPSPPPPSPPPPSPSPPPPSPPPPHPPPPSPSPPPPSPSPPPPSPPPPHPPPPSPSPPPPSPPPPSPPPPSPSPPPPSPSPPPPSPPPPPPKKKILPPPPEGPSGSVESAPNAPPPPPKKKKPPPPSGPSGSVESAPSAPPPPPLSEPPECLKYHRHRRNTSVSGDPHFVGKHGERFDFHGHPGHDYCIISDRDLHINMHVFKGLRHGITFVSRIGVLYKTNKILVEAHANEEASSLEEQWKVIMNDVELPLETIRKGENGLVVTHMAKSLHVQAQDEIDFNITVMPASFGRHGSGANYLNFVINQLKVTPTIHGVLGQTYQETLRAYQKLHNARGKKRSRAAHYFMDGVEKDYEASSTMAPDCKFSTFEDPMKLHLRMKRVVLERAQGLFGLNKVEVIKQCAGFGDESLCFNAEQEDELMP